MNPERLVAGLDIGSAKTTGFFPSRNRALAQRTRLAAELLQGLPALVGRGQFLLHCVQPGLRLGDLTASLAVEGRVGHRLV